MEKPFDFDVLKEKLKAQGLPVLEDTVEKVALTVLDWVVDSALVHENGLVKAIVPAAVLSIKPAILEKIDGIDGKKG